MNLNDYPYLIIPKVSQNQNIEENVKQLLCCNGKSRIYEHVCNVAKENFNVDDSDVLSAIACHNTLKANASQYDMALFIADKLAWDQEGTPPFYNDVANALKTSLEKACFVYMKYMNENNKILFPHTDWNEGYKWIIK